MRVALPALHMIHMHRRWEAPSAGLVLERHEARSDGIVLVRDRFGPRTRSRCSLIERMQGPSEPRGAPWTSVCAPLAGTMRVRHRGRELELEPGEMLVATFDMAHSHDGELDVVRVLVRQGEEIPPSDEGVWRLGATGRAALRRLGAELARSGSTGTRSLRDAVSWVASVATAAGIALPPRAVRERVVEASAHDARIASAIEASTARFSERPHGVDLAQHLGISERHALRLVNEHIARHFVSVPTWRALIGEHRLWLGVLLLGTGRARTEEASRWLGHTSPTSLCHAFARAQLPSPGALGHALSQLG